LWIEGGPRRGDPLIWGNEVEQLEKGGGFATSLKRMKNTTSEKSPKKKHLLR